MMGYFNFKGPDPLWKIFNLAEKFLIVGLNIPIISRCESLPFVFVFCFSSVFSNHTNSKDSIDRFPLLFLPPSTLALPIPWAIPQPYLIHCLCHPLPLALILPMVERVGKRVRLSWARLGLRCMGMQQAADWVEGRLEIQSRGRVDYEAHYSAYPCSAICMGCAIFLWGWVLGSTDFLVWVGLFYLLCFPWASAPPLFFITLW